MKFSIEKIPIVKRVLDAAVNFLNDRNPREKLMILVFGGVTVLLVDYFIWLAPVTHAITKTMPGLSALHQELDTLREDKKASREIQGKWDEIQAGLIEKEKGFQGPDQLPALLENLSKLASEAGVRITSLKPVGESIPVSGKLYFSVPIQLNASASTHELGAFLSKLETDVTFFKVSNLKITQNMVNPRKHTIEMMLETYQKV